MFLFKLLCKLQKILIINHLSLLTACSKLQKFKNELKKNREKVLGAASESSSKTRKKEVSSLFKLISYILFRYFCF